MPFELQPHLEKGDEVFPVSSILATGMIEVTKFLSSI